MDSLSLRKLLNQEYNTFETHVCYLAWFYASAEKERFPIFKVYSQ